MNSVLLFSAGFIACTSFFSETLDDTTEKINNTTNGEVLELEGYIIDVNDDFNASALENLGLEMEYR